MKKLAIAGLATVVSTAAVADVQWYGFLKGDVTRADKMDNDHKPYYATAKGTEYSKYDKQTHSVMSFRDSRLGAKMSNGSKVSGVLEFDFDGESSKDTDGVSSSDSGMIRWRQANISYKIGSNGTLTFGKKWSAFSALNQHTMQVTQVGLYQGNTGYIHDGIEYKHMMGDLGLTFELGGSDADDSAADKRANKISNPSMTFRLDYKLADHTFGFAYAMASKNLKKSDNDLTDDAGTKATNFDEDADITAMKLFGDMNFGMTNVRFEYAQGKNAVGTGWLSKAILNDVVAAANVNDPTKLTDVEETAMWLSAKHTMGKSAVWARHGVTEITNADKAGGAAANRIAAGKVVKNAVTGLGYSRELDEGFKVYAEYSMVTTDRVKTKGTTETNSDDGTVLDFGMMYSF